jgi:ribokinase
MIVVFGSVGVDIVTRIPRFPMPGETVSCGAYDVVPGTKGANQALAAARAGSRVALVATRGDDAFGTVAVSLLAEAGVDLSDVRASTAPTGLCTIAVRADGENTVIAAAGANGETVIADLERVPFTRGDTLILQREIPDSETFAAVSLARGRGARIVLNVAPAGVVPDTVLADVDVLIVNEVEAAAVGRSLETQSDEPEMIGRALSLAHGCLTVVTLGGRGAVLWDGATATHAEALAIQAVDTTAAGDSFVGYFAAALDAGLDPAMALRRAAAAGSLCCTKAGAQPAIPWRLEVDQALPSSPA